MASKNRQKSGDQKSCDLVWPLQRVWFKFNVCFPSYGKCCKPDKLVARVYLLNLLTKDHYIPHVLPTVEQHLCASHLANPVAFSPKLFVAHTVVSHSFVLVQQKYSETWELGTPKGLYKTVLNSEVVLFLRPISVWWIDLGTDVAVLHSQVVPISQVVLKTGFTVLLSERPRWGFTRWNIVSSSILSVGSAVICYSSQSSLPIARARVGRGTARSETYGEESKVLRINVHMTTESGAFFSTPRKHVVHLHYTPILDWTCTAWNIRHAAQRQGYRHSAVGLRISRQWAIILWSYYSWVSL